MRKIIPTLLSIVLVALIAGCIGGGEDGGGEADASTILSNAITKMDANTEIRIKGEVSKAVTRPSWQTGLTPISIPFTAYRSGNLFRNDYIDLSLQGFSGMKGTRAYVTDRNAYHCWFVLPVTDYFTCDMWEEVYFPPIEEYIWLMSDRKTAERTASFIASGAETVTNTGQRTYAGRTCNYMEISVNVSNVSDYSEGTFDAKDIELIDGIYSLRNFPPEYVKEVKSLEKEFCFDTETGYILYAGIEIKSEERCARGPCGEGTDNITTIKETYTVTSFEKNPVFEWDTFALPGPFGEAPTNTTMTGNTVVVENCVESADYETLIVRNTGNVSIPEKTVFFAYDERRSLYVCSFEATSEIESGASGELVSSPELSEREPVQSCERGEWMYTGYTYTLVSSFDYLDVAVFNYTCSDTCHPCNCPEGYMATDCCAVEDETSGCEPAAKISVEECLVSDEGPTYLLIDVIGAKPIPVGAVFEIYFAPPILYREGHFIEGAFVEINSTTGELTQGRRVTLPVQGVSSLSTTFYGILSTDLDLSESFSCHPG